MNKRIFLLILIVFLVKETRADNYAPVVRIESPKNNSKFKLKEEITFKGKVTDLEDGELLGEALIWTSDMDGRIGQGNSFRAVLSEGVHIVILTATDSGNSVARDSIFIIIGTPPEPISEVEKPKEGKSKPEKPKIETPKLKEQAIPSIEFLFVPPFGSFGNLLQGQILNADPNKFTVAVYIMKNGVWWSKSVIRINKDGRWLCDITTAEDDELAIKIAAYLIPIDYQPPVASGDFWIVKEIEEKCLARIEVTRKIRLESKGKPEIKKTRKKPVPKGPIEALGELLVQLLPKEKQTTESLRRYLPLAVGNKWTYQRTVYQSDEVFHYGKQIIEKPNWNSPPRGAVYFTVGRTIEKMPYSSRETYTISNFTLADKFAFWEVEIEGIIPRDGRYSSLYTKKEPNVKWLYVNEGIWEIMDGEYSDAETKNQTWLAVLKPGIIISDSVKQGETPFWAIGAVLTPEKITTPAGKFLNCLKNCTMIRGQNLKEVLLENKPPEYLEWEDGFGSFTTISYYAKDVGLIKEVQYNSKGEVTYKLELIDYNVK